MDLEQPDDQTQVPRCRGNAKQWLQEKPIVKMMGRRGGDGDGGTTRATPVQPGEVSVPATVSLTYQIE